MPYGQERFKELMKERYLLTKHLNISYLDTGKISPTERTYLMQFLSDDFEREKTLIEQQKQQMG